MLGETCTRTRACTIAHIEGLPYPQPQQGQAIGGFLALCASSDPLLPALGERACSADSLHRCSFNHAPLLQSPFHPSPPAWCSACSVRMPSSLHSTPISRFCGTAASTFPRVKCTVSTPDDTDRCLSQVPAYDSTVL